MVRLEKGHMCNNLTQNGESQSIFLGFTILGEIFGYAGNPEEEEECPPQFDVVFIDLDLYLSWRGHEKCRISIHVCIKKKKKKNHDEDESHMFLIFISLDVI